MRCRTLASLSMRGRQHRTAATGWWSSTSRHCRSIKQAFVADLSSRQSWRHGVAHRSNSAVRSGCNGVARTTVAASFMTTAAAHRSIGIVPSSSDHQSVSSVRTAIPEWGSGGYSSPKNIFDLAQMGTEVTHCLLDNDAAILREDEVEWRRDSRLDSFATTLVGQHAATTQLVNQLDNTNAESDKDKQLMQTTVNNCTVRHLGDSVIASDVVPYSANPILDDLGHDGGFAAVGMMSSRHTRSMVNESMELIKQRQRVVIVQSDGLDIAQSTLMSCLAALLHEGAAVLYIAYRKRLAYLFLPTLNGESVSGGADGNGGGDGGKFEGWSTDYLCLKSTRLRFDKRLILLVDPPERAQYPSYAWGACFIKVCNSNAEQHFYKDDKYSYVRLCYPSLPTLEEIFSMATALWRDATSNLPGVSCRSDQERRNILAMRAYLVGYHPRYLFDFAAYVDRLDEINTKVLQVPTDQKLYRRFNNREPAAILSVPASKETYSGDILQYYPSELYELNGVPEWNHKRTTVSLNGHARARLLETLFLQDRPHGLPKKSWNELPSEGEFGQILDGYLTVDGTFMMTTFSFDPIGKKVSTRLENVIVPARTAKRGETAMSRQEWWDSQCDMNNERPRLTSLLSRMRASNASNLTYTLFVRGKSIDAAWLSQDVITDDIWQRLEHVTIRLWPSDQPFSGNAALVLEPLLNSSEFAVPPAAHDLPASVHAAYASAIYQVTTNSTAYKECFAKLKPHV